MKRMFLLDTNVLSEPRRPRPNRQVVRRLLAHAAQAATCAPVWHELVFGVERLPDSRRRETLRRYLQEVLAPAIPVLPYDEEAAAWHAGERARLARAGKEPPFVDGQIAAVAAVNGLILVTANTRDFALFKDLRVADWS